MPTEIHPANTGIWRFADWKKGEGFSKKCAKACAPAQLLAYGLEAFKNVAFSAHGQFLVRIFLRIKAVSYQALISVKYFVSSSFLLIRPSLMVRPIQQGPNA
ncbi:hypothetical protein [Pseudomonas cichorii]|uniref:hypothetical protein n=1 Tax=Pseudomonas cichorii TaxID=36746 RepID=UPI001C897BA9|nr:hypothetical protein [Pseudomonas cichorii]MBX8497807.1 hypothetical protein [Pseudomonas cichorii]MBX8531851.1 hypothetical protein [Pseudomonas cichorii]